MNLCILNQNRTILINVKNLLIDDNNHSIYTVETLDRGIHTATLGEYESKERAMEVLQEICKYKDKLDKANFLGMTESEFVSSIFEMPEK